jgi:predicted nucleic acid-binding protein
LILVDTSVWVPALRAARSPRASSPPEALELARLVELDEVAITDFVAAEVLQGAIDEAEYRDLADKLDAVHFFHATEQTWLRAARRSFELMKRGLPTPLSDLVIAEVALENGIAVYTVDEHFDRVDGLRLHRVGS